MSTDKSDLNQGPVGWKLMQISGPMTFGILGVLLIGLADAFFLARAGEAELTAIGFVYPVIVTVSAFSVGLSAGANTALSQAHGRAETDRSVAHLGFHACLMGLAFGLVIGGLLWVVSPALFSLLGARDAVLDNVLAYVPYWAASFPILVLTMILNSAFRAVGDGTTAAVVMVLTAALNIALTPVLIFGYGPAPEMGMAGAGFATLLARIAALIVVLVLAWRRALIWPGSEPLKGLGKSLRTILSTALPAGASRAINPAGMAVVTAAVAVVGDAAVAGFGAASRVQSLALVPFFALAAGLAPVVGQAWGAEDASRARAATRLAAKFTVAYGAALAVVLFAFADPIARIMTDSGTAAGFTADYLRIVGVTLAGYGMAVGANAAMTGRSRAAWAMGLSLSRITLVYIPLAWVGVMVAGYNGVLAAAALANVYAFWGAMVALSANDIGPTGSALVAGPGKRLGRIVHNPSGDAAA